MNDARHTDKCCSIPEIVMYFDDAPACTREWYTLEWKDTFVLEQCSGTLSTNMPIILAVASLKELKIKPHVYLYRFSSRFLYAIYQNISINT